MRFSIVDIKEITAHRNSLRITITLNFLWQINIKGPLQKWLSQVFLWASVKAGWGFPTSTTHALHNYLLPLQPPTSTSTTKVRWNFN